MNKNSAITRINQYCMDIVYAFISMWHVLHVDWVCENSGRKINKLSNHNYIYRQISNIRRPLVGNKIGDHSDVAGASPVGAAPTTSSFSS